MDNKKNHRILIATGIFPPDIGGPATFAKILFENFPEYGHSVKIVTFGKKNAVKDVYYINRNQNIFFRYFNYFRQIYKLSKWSDVIYAFDLISVGFPCALVKLVRPKVRFIVRLGGDYQWEHAVQSGRHRNTLENYYEYKKFNFKEKIIYFLNDLVLKNADAIIFNSEYLKHIYVKFRGVDLKKIAVIKNIYPDRRALSNGVYENLPVGTNDASNNNEIKILFAGRLIAVRNLPKVLEIIKDINEGKFKKNVTFEIYGDGPEKGNVKKFINDNVIDKRIKLFSPLDRKDLLDKIANSDISILPSLTDINSNFVSESLALGKKVILTKFSESYFIGNNNKLIYYINPLDIKDIKNKIYTAIQDCVNGENGIAAKEDSDKKDSWRIEKILDEHNKLFLKL